MPSLTNSEIDCLETLEDPGSFTVVKRKKNEPEGSFARWSKEAEQAAALLAPLPEAEQKLMLERLRLALGVEGGKYVGGEQPIPQWAPGEKNG